MSDDESIEACLPELYDALRRVARARLRDTPGNHTLQATELVHEAYVRLARDPKKDLGHRQHLFVAAACSIRDVLVDRARKRCARKRGGDHRHRQLEEIEHASTARPEDVLAIEDVLERLNDGARQMVELRFYGGMSLAEIASLLEQPLRTLERRWRFTKASLAALLQPEGGDG